MNKDRREVILRLACAFASNPNCKRGFDAAQSAILAFNELHEASDAFREDLFEEDAPSEQAAEAPK